jgi:apolipoprotein N-acyltransferase
VPTHGTEPPRRRLTVVLPRPGERLLPVVAAILLALAYPPLHLVIPSFVGLVPMAVWLARLPAGREGSRAAARGGLLFGLVYFGIVVYWILVALIWFTKLAILAYLGSLVLLMGAAAVFAYTVHRLYHGAGLPLWLALPLGWTFAEWFRAHWPEQLAFPWLGLGTSLTGYPELVGIAEIVGARGVTFWLALANGILAGMVLTFSGGTGQVVRARLLRAGVALAAVVALPMVWGVWRAGTLELRSVGQIAVMQPNIPEHIKLDRDAVMDSTWASVERLMPQVEQGANTLVVWPEVTLPDFIEARPGLQEAVQAHARAAGSPILFGAYGYRSRGDAPVEVFNSAFMVEPDGWSGYRYDKVYLVPVVERVPLVKPEWFGDLRYFGGLGMGEGWPLAQVQGVSYGTLICYESTYAEGSRAYRQAGADVLLNITNDAWYGREPWYARTTALWQHPAHMVMRAIENRVGVARAANTGISLFVDPVGRVYGEIGLFQAGIRSEEVFTTDVLTFYTRFGDLVGNGAAALSLVLLGWLMASDRRRRRAGTVGPDASS